MSGTKGAYFTVVLHLKVHSTSGILVAIATDQGSQSTADFITRRQESGATSLEMVDDHSSSSVVLDLSCNCLKAVVIGLSWQSPRVTGKCNLHQSENSFEIHFADFVLTGWMPMVVEVVPAVYICTAAAKIRAPYRRKFFALLKLDQKNESVALYTNDGICYQTITACPNNTVQ